MTTQTKNTTAVERRIARRQALADALNTAAKAVEAIGARSDFIREAATELLIGNTEILLAQQWATDDGKPGQVRQVGPAGVVRYVDPPTAGEPTCRCFGLAVVAPAVDEVMVGRALDAWEQYAGCFTGTHDYLFRRTAMKFALEQALKVRA